ncbi:MULTISPECIES: carbonic anhydrase family protein [unclassified Nitrobacter]|uniref:carbonic anhydrase family protein n=1 Tax=unclassified Nitrobacter TaxID=2620411 RepID=UPI0009292E0E|nr:MULTISPECIES: carbonic anhydrase family protein [unclassified Nitrobacter]MBN9148151.1 carbonic anhydrase [Nitrobacter sp.]OJV00449.1 MAG: carbonic anhydrase [Nitrobacter sp. 62-23]
MLNRRLFCGCVSFALFAGATAGSARAEPAECAVFTPDRQKHTSPDEAIARLKAGNDRFVAGATVNCDLMAQVRETAKAQAPFAAIVGCIDSRVPPELVFDQRIGDVFCARIAGNFVNDDIIGSLEFATQVAGARAIVVLGHSSCGAVMGAIDGVKLGHLTGALAHIQPAVSATKAEGKPSSKNDAFVQAVAETNARMAAADLTKRSTILKALAEKGELRTVAAMHDLATGRVKWLS